MLTDLLIKNATANGKDYKLSDSGGMHLFVSKSGHRSWRLKYRFGGKERRLMIGSYPDVSLKDARERRNAARTLLASGRDPGIEAQRAKVEQTLAAANDFETVARAWFELQKGRWTPIHASDVIKSLEKEVFPWIGRLPVKEIDEPLLLSVLRKVERRGAIETAHRVRQRISAVFVHAIAEGVAARDPAAVITKALKPVPRSRKRPALLALDALHDLIRKTECEPASPITKLASRFMALTAQRPGMVRALARDPETRDTSGGTTVTQISVVTDRPARDKEGKTYKDDKGFTLTLASPQTGNAMTAAMRDALYEALANVLDDPGAPQVILKAEGRCFSTGGHLPEFGTATDLAQAHAIRTLRSSARLVHRLGDRIEVRLHGACIGSGIEVAATAARRIGSPNTFVQLPELRMGLIPGAGGTVSIARAIGRQRLMWLVLGAFRLGAEKCPRVGPASRNRRLT